MSQHHGRPSPANHLPAPNHPTFHVVYCQILRADCLAFLVRPAVFLAAGRVTWRGPPLSCVPSHFLPDLCLRRSAGLLSASSVPGSMDHTRELLDGSGTSSFALCRVHSTHLRLLPLFARFRSRSQSTPHSCVLRLSSRAGRMHHLHSSSLIRAAFPSRVCCYQSSILDPFSRASRGEAIFGCNSNKGGGKCTTPLI